MSETRTGSYALVQGDTATTPKGKITAKTESQELAAKNNHRVALFVTNGSAKEVWLSLGSAAVAEEGIYLKNGGGSIELTTFLGAVFIITKEGEGVVSFSEV